LPLEALQINFLYAIIYFKGTHTNHHGMITHSHNELYILILKRKTAGSDDVGGSGDKEGACTFSMNSGSSLISELATDSGCSGPILNSADILQLG